MIFCDNDYQYLKSKNLNNHIRKQKKPEVLNQVI